MKKIRQYQISEMAKISPSMLSEILTGKARPSWKTAKRLATVTNSNPVQWLEGTPEVLRQVIAEYGQTSFNEERTAP